MVDSDSIILTMATSFVESRSKMFEISDRDSVAEYYNQIKRAVEEIKVSLSGSID